MIELQNDAPVIKKPVSLWRHIFNIVAVIFIISCVLIAGLVFKVIAYADRVSPNLSIGEVSIGGMNAQELEDFLQSMDNKLASEGIHFYFDNNGKKEQFTIFPIVANEGSAIDLISIDTEKEVKRLIRYGKAGNVLSEIFLFSQNRLTKPSVAMKSIDIDKENFSAELFDNLSKFVDEPVNASIKIVSTDPLKYEITSSSPGVVFEYGTTIEKVSNSWAKLEMPDIEVNKKLSEPKVNEEQVASITSRLPAIFSEDKITITYKDPVSLRTFDWAIDKEKIAEWIDVQEAQKGGYTFGLNKKLASEYLSSVVAPRVSVEGRNAKFSVDANGKVSEFQGSRPGVKLNIDETYNALNQIILDRMSHNEGVAKSIQLVVEKVEPDVTTGEVNDMGISEVLGVGVSNFSGSPTNRIKNIKNAVAKLNGILIKPDEEFSAIKFTQPYTLEGGYLPELVIKGDQIKPEIGGGLCQIGTTLFRMAMNSGMPITERRNHSLVVNYYNDPSNGLPGTDATIYEPSPDFRFKNDTGHYILIQTVADLEKSELLFTLWGTNDGRKGWYDAPVVKKWIAHGPTKIVETTNLEPGKKNCQHAYRGAETSFTYYRQPANGEKIAQLFESYYRPLPEICLVGVEKVTTECALGEDGLPAEGCVVTTTPSETVPSEIPAESVIEQPVIIE